MNAEIKQMKTAAETALAEAYASQRAKLPGSGAVVETREAAFRRFETQGLPHRRVEEWKYTDLRALMREAKPLAGAPDAAAKTKAKSSARLLAEGETRRIVFVDGAFVPEFSDVAKLEAGLTIMSLASALAGGDSFVAAKLGRTIPDNGDVAFALNTALMGDGAVIRIAKGTTLARPIELAFCFSSPKAAAVFTRSLIEVGEGVSATIIETHEGPDGVDYQVNTALELTVGDGAHVDHIRVGRDGADALHVATLAASLGANAVFHDFSFTTGSAVTRNQLFVRCDGEGTVLRLDGANLIKGRQHVDTTLVVDHAIGGCNGRELFKSVLDHESRAVFQGKIIVRPDAQKTDSKMMAQALMLSEDAEVDSKPELEIFADDVVCGHGATAGALDEDLLFYLKARGIPGKEAEALLIQAFVGEAVEAIEHEGVRDALNAAAARWLQARAM